MKCVCNVSEMQLENKITIDGIKTQTFLKL